MTTFRFRFRFSFQRNSFLLLCLLLAVMLSGCQSLDIPPADTFNKQAAAAKTSVNTASQLSLTLLQARKITPDESDRFIDRSEEADRAIDLARSLKLTDPTSAADNLSLAIEALDTLILELKARQ